jgi:putative spermidine/putrescine transport system substrate-binding protein
MKRLAVLLCSVLIFATACSTVLDSASQDSKSWKLIEESAQNSVVTIAIDTDNEALSEWLKGDFSDYVKTNYKIDLNIFEQPLTKTFDALQYDVETENATGQYDVVFLGENTLQGALSKGYLYGPFSADLPSVTDYLNPNGLENEYNDAAPIGGYAVPFARTQLMMIYNQDVFYDPPETISDMLAMASTYTGQMTYPDPRTSEEGEAFLITILAPYLDIEAAMSGRLTAEDIETAVTPGLNALKTIEPKLYGEYPESADALDALFKAGEVIYSMSLDSNYVTKALKTYEYVDGASVFIPAEGTAGYAEYAGIAYNSPNKSGAMVVLNSLLSPEMQGALYNPSDVGLLPVYDPGYTDGEAYTDIAAVKIKSSAMAQEDLLSARVPMLPEVVRNQLVTLWTQVVAEPVETVPETTEATASN